MLSLVRYQNAESLRNEVASMQIPEVIRERMRETPGGEAARKEDVKIAREMLFAVRDRVRDAYLMPPRVHDARLIRFPPIETVRAGVAATQMSAFAPASVSLRIPMICSSVNRFRFIARHSREHLRRADCHSACTSFRNAGRSGVDTARARATFPRTPKRGSARHGREGDEDRGASNHQQVRDCQDAAHNWLWATSHRTDVSPTRSGARRADFGCGVGTSGCWGKAPPADTILQPADMTALSTSNDAPRAHAVTATRSRPTSELVVAMIASVLLHIAWFAFFVATVGLRPVPSWVVFAADPQAVDEVIIRAPAPEAASVRTAALAVAKREPGSRSKQTPLPLVSPPSAAPPPAAEPRAEVGSPPDQLGARPAGGETPESATPSASPRASQITPSEPVARVPDPTSTPPVGTVARIREARRDIPAAPADLPTASAASEPQFPTVAKPGPSPPSPATAAASILPPSPGPRPTRSMPALGRPTSDITARALIHAPATTVAPPGPEPSEETAQLPAVGPPADDGLAASAGATSPTAPTSGRGPVDTSPDRDAEALPPLTVPPGVTSAPAEPKTGASAPRQSVDSRSASSSVPSGVTGEDVSGETTNRVERSSAGTDDTTRTSRTRAAAGAGIPQSSDPGRPLAAGAAERPDTPAVSATQQGRAPVSRETMRPGTGVAGPQRSPGPGALRLIAPHDGFTLGGEDAPIVVVEGHVEDVDDTTVWLVANGYRAPVRVRDGRFRHAMPVLERTTRLWIEAKAAVGEPARKSGEITVVNTVPGPVSVLAIEGPLNGGARLQVTASWRPLADRFDGVVNGIPLRRFDAGRDVEPSTFFYMRHSQPGVFSLIVRGDILMRTVSTRLFHLLNGQFTVRDVRSVPLGSGGSGIAARILFPFGVEWGQSEWFTGRAEGPDTITQFRFPEGVGWTERRVDLR